MSKSFPHPQELAARLRTGGVEMIDLRTRDTRALRAAAD